MAGFWDAPRDQSWGLDWHRNEGIEITYLESGSLDFAADGKPYHLQAGDLTIMRPWQLHRVGNPNVAASRLHWLILDLGVRRPDQTWRWPPWILLAPPDLEQLTRTLRCNEQPVWRANAEVRRCFQAIAHAIEADAAGSSVSRLTLRLNELFVLLLDLLREKKVPLDQALTTTRRTIQLFLEDLRANPQHLALDWTVEEMARTCGLGISQFTQHVRSLVNLTPMQYLIQCRVDRAAVLLRQTPALSITDTALECGFSSGQYFATAFRRRFGLSPREARTGEGNVRNLAVEKIRTTAAGPPL
jgi:AraC-like DNA-binding protein